MKGRLYVGTSGFGYPGWVPRFYPAGTRAGGLLPAYAARLPAVELNGTFYRQASPATVAAWSAAVPEGFRFVVKALRSGSSRALGSDPAGTLPWLLAPYRALGERLGAVLFRVGEERPRDDAGLDALLAAWPPELPVAIEFRHPSWLDDEVLARLRAAGVLLCVTESADDPEPPIVRLTGAHLYLRLRRDDYTDPEMAAWSARIEPFLAAGRNAFVFFKHDPVGRGGELAVDLRERLAGYAPG